jgi:hypothetical protein
VYANGCDLFNPSIFAICLILQYLPPYHSLSLSPPDTLLLSTLNPSHHRLTPLALLLIDSTPTESQIGAIRSLSLFPSLSPTRFLSHLYFFIEFLVFPVRLAPPLPDRQPLAELISRGSNFLREEGKTESLPYKSTDSSQNLNQFPKSSCTCCHFLLSLI